MRHILMVVLLLFSSVILAQTKGIISGVVKDGEMNGEPLAFANVFIKGTTIGTTTEFEGDYIFKVAPGTYTVVFSFVGYETIEVPNVVVKAGKTTKLNKTLKASQGMQLEEVQVTATTKKESEKALLAEQKKAVVIKESIGAKQLAAQGVSNAATATAKISGVTKSEGSGDVFVRGLGDRYLSTTMNGLPIPSDNVDKKNIDLNLFGTGVIENVGISKTYSVQNYIDQASGNIDIVSKGFSNTFSVALNGGVNTNLFENGIWKNFKISPNQEDVVLGFYSRSIPLKEAVYKQSWNTKIKSMPLDVKMATSGGFKLNVFDKELSVFYTLSHKNSFNHKKGVYRRYDENIKKGAFTDAETYSYGKNTTGLLNIRYPIADGHKMAVNTLFINKMSDNVYEQGRNKKGFMYDMDDIENSFFVRDQNTKTTMLLVNQLIGQHQLTENNKLEWAAAYNMVNADEPNRLRNETGFVNDKLIFSVSGIGDFSNRKSSQEIKDREVNGYVKDKIELPHLGEQFYINIGANIRNKKRDFRSQFIGVDASGLVADSVDDLSQIFTTNSFDKSRINDKLSPEVYEGKLKVYGGFANFGFQFKKLTGNVGVRYEYDQINVLWKFNNSGEGDTQKEYSSVYPSVNLKYEINEKNSLRLASSKTVTLPEFKELAPFEYVSPTGRITKGTPELKESVNYNLDVKWEYFMNPGDLISLTGFYKKIEDPINITSLTGGAGYLVFENTGEKADVYGIEFETRFNLLKTKANELRFGLNATKMWFQQDLLEKFQYNYKTTSGLQGASDFIINNSISYKNKESNFNATVSFNYSSDKIYALGSPKSATSRNKEYNSDIIEKGFATLDAVLSKDITEHLSIKISGKNLLNPEIKQEQEVKPLSAKVGENQVVRSYKKGIKLGVGIKYVF